MPDAKADAMLPWKALDDSVHAALSRACLSISPHSVLLAWMDWATHLAASPGKCLELARLAIEQAGQMQAYLHECLAGLHEDADAGVAPPLEDRRFRDPAWQRWPFNVLHQSFLMHERWWDEATRGVWGVDPHHEHAVAFAARQWLDMFSPGNLPLANPVVLRRTAEERGANLLRGFDYLRDDLSPHQRQTGPGEFVVGRDVAVTPGKVVLKNRLIELIQYAPATGKVHPEPILIVPAWIMKYYILDLSPHNSLVRYLVEQGYTVFCISWKNPDADDRDLGMDDYLNLGFHAALDAVAAIVPGRKVHATGYCLGGTLLAIAAAAMARDGDDRLASLSLFTAQTDFTEPGELALFIDESQIALLEAQMADTGYLFAEQMGGAFMMLRSYDLLWSRLVGEYLLGERRPMNDLMAWNADATRMPAKMHAQYLRRLFLDDDLSEGRHPVGGRSVSLGDIRLPVFSVGTVADHVAPWRSVYKLHYLSPTEITFVLTTGGHNAGIVSEPGRPRRQYQLHTRPAGGGYIAPDEWQAAVPVQQGSWWPAWADWLRQRSGEPGEPPRMGLPGRGRRVLGDAPGEYVRGK
ncbi:PHA/PHB synthase family protein [Thauera linaloolentis]|uniref:Putative poly-beta-hydroxyalkanoate synthase n=1 Tax=Thauera linaloolentis (strain DSM 12138 / JCM 21573 / CCUG 41526 / CIP 105981 / IAM 15112 / NBRC 102519 / 47Lol) TaxID=1123367 RepID=N6Z455_THAL4|nr:alpha/beta fold hydrolase [Thauera linaloolentis]ENO89357.1 putative poly-beta-hydroxyalkanoate synthase [Thauera linaloolentis 47Lol = DSM 12138]MCM8564993.1 alpha/beta fold hydrolase [Thauera linaloolentis]